MYENIICTFKKSTGVIRFLFVGMLNTLIDISLFMVFANFIGIYPVVASVLSTGMTLVFSFFMNHHFVFKSERKRRSTLVAFVLVTLFNVWVIQSTVIYFAIHGLGHLDIFDGHIWTLNLTAKLVGVSVSTILNYYGYKRIFKGANDGKETEN